MLRNECLHCKYDNPDMKYYIGRNIAQNLSKFIYRFKWVFAISSYKLDLLFFSSGK